MFYYGQKHQLLLRGPVERFLGATTDPRALFMPTVVERAHPRPPPVPEREPTTLVSRIVKMLRTSCAWHWNANHGITSSTEATGHCCSTPLQLFHETDSMMAMLLAVRCCWDASVLLDERFVSSGSRKYLSTAAVRSAVAKAKLTWQRQVRFPRCNLVLGFFVSCVCSLIFR